MSPPTTLGMAVGPDVARSCGAGVAAGTSGTNSTTSTTSASASSHGPVGTAGQAIAIAEGGRNAQTITRGAAKLTTFAQVNAAAAPQMTLELGASESPSARVRIVALSGPVPPFGLAAEPDDTWSAVVIDQQTREGTASFAGRDGDWPPWFDSLRDLAQAS